AIGNRIKGRMMEEIKEWSEVSELFKKEKEGVKWKNEGVEGDIDELEDEMEEVREENEVFDELLEDFDSRGFMKLNRYGDDGGLKNGIKGLKEG
ncbi:hypothetical protein, partial [Staphylococcus epidermidis]|uniref:hypothetical protein n=1 Tax=Staphylococcus epidermidis TaxID=1282 RepID=UPI001C931848